MCIQSLDDIEHAMQLCRKGTATKLQQGKTEQWSVAIAAATVLAECSLRCSLCRRRSDARRGLLHCSVSDDALSKLLLGFGETGTGRPIKTMHLVKQQQRLLTVSD